MKACEVVRNVMKLRNIRVNDLAEGLGLKQPTISERLKQDNLSTGKMVEMLSAMQYKLVAVPVGRQLSDADCFEITKEK